MGIVIGIDVACRSSHRAACADVTGNMVWKNISFQTRTEELEALWKRIPLDYGDVTVVMEPTRNAWVPLAAWLQRQGAKVIMVPPEQSADLRSYYSKHTKTDRLDAELLARIPILHPSGMHAENGLGAAEPLRRAVKIRSTLVKRRTTCMQRLDALLEILGPDLFAALGSAMTITILHFLSRWPDPRQVLKLGKSRLSRWLYRQSHGKWGDAKAEMILSAARRALQLWGSTGIDFEALGADIALEADLALQLDHQIRAIDQRIKSHYQRADPDLIVQSIPGLGPVLAAQIVGRLGDPQRFNSLSAVRSYTGLVPRLNSSGVASAADGPTKQGDACLREAIFMAADQMRRIDPSLARRYQRLMLEGKHHNSAICSVGAIVISRIASCLRTGKHYELRDVDGALVTEENARLIVSERYLVSEEIRKARRVVQRIKGGTLSCSHKAGDSAPIQEPTKHQSHGRSQ